MKKAIRFDGIRNPLETFLESLKDIHVNDVILINTGLTNLTFEKLVSSKIYRKNLN